jgi:hypothetical protein
MLVQLQGRPVRRKPYRSDVSDEEWAFVAPYLTLCREDAAQQTLAGLHYVPFACLLLSKAVKLLEVHSSF